MAMIPETFDEFTESSDALRIYQGSTLIFNSAEKGLGPLLEYIRRFVPRVRGVTAFDRVIGNAGALLLREALCVEAFSPLGSELAAHTLKQYGIRFCFSSTVPFILNRAGSDMCPMERLSLGKDPRVFLDVLQSQG
ncbi:MAG: DUF1893 domain-containing protein [Dehalococcoidia bacterium]|nr:DUF1893 domain-containing protein [Dehalococcoidia bacterium]